MEQKLLPLWQTFPDIHLIDIQQVTCAVVWGAVSGSPTSADVPGDCPGQHSGFLGSYRVIRLMLSPKISKQKSPLTYSNLTFGFVGGPKPGANSKPFVEENLASTRISLQATGLLSSPGHCYGSPIFIIK